MQKHTISIVVFVGTSVSGVGEGEAFGDPTGFTNDGAILGSKFDVVMIEVGFGLLSSDTDGDVLNTSEGGLAVSGDVSGARVDDLSDTCKIVG